MKTWSYNLVRVDTRSSCLSMLVESADSCRTVGIESQYFAADSSVTASDHFGTPRNQAAFRMQLAS